LIAIFFHFEPPHHKIIVKMGMMTYRALIPLDLVGWHKEMLGGRSRGYEGTRSYEWVLQSPVRKDIPKLIDAMF
jgi:hypothetical protein